MGATVSHPDEPKKCSYSEKRRKNDKVVRLLFPVYYVDEPVSSEGNGIWCFHTVVSHSIRVDTSEIQMGRMKWNLILNDTCPYFNHMRRKGVFQQPSCLSLFYDSFYSRLFDIHPVSYFHVFLNFHWWLHNLFESINHICCLFVCLFGSLSGCENNVHCGAEKSRQVSGEDDDPHAESDWAREGVWVQEHHVHSGRSAQSERSQGCGMWVTELSDWCWWNEVKWSEWVDFDSLINKFLAVLVSYSC